MISETKIDQSFLVCQFETDGFKDTLKAFDDFKNKQQKFME